MIYYLLILKEYQRTHFDLSGRPFIEYLDPSFWEIKIEPETEPIFKLKELSELSEEEFRILIEPLISPDPFPHLILAPYDAETIDTWILPFCDMTKLIIV